MKALFRDAWKLAAPYWRSPEKWRARLLLAAIIGLNLGQVYLAVQFNAWRNAFYNSLQNYDKVAFFASVVRFSCLAAADIVSGVYAYYLYQVLQIRWRRWMTDYCLGQWMKSQAFYRLQTEGNPADNPDQRISEDIDKFITNSLDLGLGVLSNVVKFFSFLTILWALSGSLDIPVGGMTVTIPGYMVWVALVYAALGTGFMRWISQPLVGLTFNQQRFEADFRFSMVRLRENSESIAFYKGEQIERKVLYGRFMNVYDNFRQIMLRQKKMWWFRLGYAQAAEIFPYIVAAPRYFSKVFKLGDLMQTGSAFGEVRDSLSYIINAYMDTIAPWQAVIGRLVGFMTSVEKMQLAAESPEAFHALPAPANDVVAEKLTLRLPTGSVLQDNLSFTVEPGQSLLVQGPSGCGKSTLLRTLAGIWPYASGKLHMPSGGKALFVPQKPYMPLGTLRECLLYPGFEASDAAVRELLEICQLGHFASRLDETQSWGQIMSLGEQQRVAFFRALLMKQDLIFLDEASSALDEPAEAYFYKLLRERLPKAVIVSVGHRSTLRQWHDRALNLQPPRTA